MKKIILYYREDSETSFQAINWLKSHCVAVSMQRIETITHREIFQLIYLSELDIPDILIDSKKPSTGFQIKKNRLNNLRFGESLVFLECDTELLKDPIILSDDYALSGFDEQKIKIFLQQLKVENKNGVRK